MKKRIITLNRVVLSAFMLVLFASFTVKHQVVFSDAKMINEDESAVASVVRGKPIGCIEEDWKYFDGECQSDGTLVRTWTKITKCKKGVTHPSTEIIECSYEPPLISGTRGMWHWKGYGDSWGTVAVVGDEAKETQVISDYQEMKVKRAYGSYGDRTVTEPNVIAAWNAKLHDAGMESQALFSNAVSDSTDSVLISEVAKNELLSDIQEEVINFNRSRTNSEERFDGLHLDIEPQVLIVEWDNGTLESRRQLMESMKDFFVEVEDLINNPTTGDPSLKLYADLGHYFDKLPADGGKVGWASESDRDQWFNDMSQSLDNVSIMAYGLGTLSSIASTTEYERSVFAQAEIGLNVKDIGSVWVDLNELVGMLEQIESSMGNETAIHSFRYLKRL